MGKDRYTGQDVTFSLTTNDGGTTLVNEQMMEIDDFKPQYKPTMETLWPAGQKAARQQLTGWMWSCVITGGLVGRGFMSLAKQQVDAAKAGNPIPLVKLTRTISRAGLGTVTETYSGGVISDVNGTQTTGDKTLSNATTIEFSDFDD